MKALIKKAQFKFDEEWDDLSTVEEFIASTKYGITPDDGGITDIIVDGMSTNIHVGIWMLHKEEENDCVMTLEELYKLPGDVKISWANK